jgi:hypothetical protein
MKAYRIYFKKNGINLTKLVYAESMAEIYIQFKGLDIIMIKQIDMLPDGEIDIISLN